MHVNTKCAIPSLFYKLRAPAVGRDNSNRNGKNNCNDNGRSNHNRKDKNNSMAIVHVAFKSSSQAPPAAAHAQYIARDGQYQQRGGVELVESGNMPEFAQADPHSFWVAADAHERANGRAYTEIQIALPRELGKPEREELAREVTRDLMGDRFAYTMAVHVPLAKDNIDQPHMHLMFSERMVDERTRELAEDRFFKRNGAKKDPAWNDRNKPEEVREKWVETMNRALERAGQEQRLDARSWAEQGREDLASLREEKTLRGDGPEAMARHEKIAEQRQQRAELPALHLDQAAAAEQIERETQKSIAEVEKRRDQELSILDKLIEKARELAVEVKERTAAVAQNVTERVEQLRGQFERWRELRAEDRPKQPIDTQRASPVQEKRELQRAGPGQDMASHIAPQIEQRLQAFRERYEANKQAREPAVVPEPPVKETAPAKEPEQELKIKRDRGFGLGL